MEIFPDYSTPPPLAMLASAFCFAPNLHRLGRILPLRLFEPPPQLGEDFWRRLRRCPSSRGGLSASLRDDWGVVS